MVNRHLDNGVPSSSTGSTSVTTQAMAPPGRDPTGHHDLRQQVAPPQMNTIPLPSVSYNNPDQNINLVNELQSLLDDTKTQETIVVDEIPGQIVSNDDRIWNLATQAAAKPGYELSFEGKELMKRGVMPGSNEWIRTFGLPQIIGTTSKHYDKEGRIMGSGSPVTTGIRRGDIEGNTDYMDEYGQIIEGGKPILTGQGKYLMDRYDEPGKYEDKTAEYYEMREAQQQGQNDPGGYYNYGSGGGSGSEGGSGYGYEYGDDPFPRGYQRAVYGPGDLMERVNQNLLRLAGLRKKRGGIVSLLELR